MPGGIFITLEGGDGSGKSTQVAALVDRLRQRKIPVTAVREPGDTRLGDLLRSVLKFGNAPRTPDAELLLFNASRSQLVSEVILPALDRGEVVISDRFADSTVAYQGYGRGIPPEKVEAVNSVGTGGLKPDLTVLLDLPPEERLKRDTWSGDRMEQKAIGSFRDAASQGYLFADALEEKDTPNPAQESSQGALFEGGYEDREAMDYHRRIRQGYLEMVRREPERWTVIDARIPQQEVSDLIWQRVEPLLTAVRGEAGRS